MAKVDGPCEDRIILDRWRYKGGDEDLARTDFIQKEVYRKFHGVRQYSGPDMCVTQPRAEFQAAQAVRNRQQCIDPLRPVIVCDDLVAGRIYDPNLDTADDRCKVSDPLHVRYKRFCAPLDPTSMRQCAASCCAREGAEPCAGFLCTPAGWLDKNSNYFRHAGLKKQNSKCRYPLPCKAHCYETHPRQNTWDPARQNAVCSRPPKTQAPPVKRQCERPPSEQHCVQLCEKADKATGVPAEISQQQIHTPSLSSQQNGNLPVKFIHPNVTFQDRATPPPSSKPSHPRTQSTPIEPRPVLRQPHHYKYKIQRPGTAAANGGPHLEYSMRKQAPSQPVMNNDEAMREEMSLERGS